MKKILVFLFLLASLAANSQIIGKWQTTAFVTSNDTTVFPKGMMEYTFYEKTSSYDLTIRNEKESKTQSGKFYCTMISENRYNLTLVGNEGTTTDEVRFVGKVGKEKLVWNVEDLHGSFILTKTK